jgi:ABC-type transporter Mla subunit MlaD
VAELGAAAPKLSRTLARVSPVAKPASRALPQVKAVLCELQPVAAYLKPYAREVTAVLQQMGYATNWYDANGHAARLFASVGENSIQFLDDKAARTVDSLLEAGLLGKIGAHGYNPFPKPGEAAETATPASPATMFDVKDTYPRIKADC